MDLSLDASDLAFRDEVQAFIARELPEEWRGVSDVLYRADRITTLKWQEKLHHMGWLTGGWPEKYGGKRLTSMQKYILAGECAAARAPGILQMEFGMIAPLLCQFGSPEQQDQYLPAILSGEAIWAQGFSEPGAGSDLASLRTRAVHDGDRYLVNGQKIWTTNAHIATHMMCLVRTDPDAAKPQTGLSILIIPMDTPGIDVRPIPTIDGRVHFNEVFLTDVPVPVSNRLGNENAGWTYAKALLQHERQGIADVQATKMVLQEIRALASEQLNSSDHRGRDSDFARRFVTLAIEIDALEILELQTMERARTNSEIGYETSMLKLSGSRLQQDIRMLALEALGSLAEASPGKNAPRHSTGLGERMVHDALFYRASTIYGGSSEVQRTIVFNALRKLGSYQ